MIQMFIHEDGRWSVQSNRTVDQEYHHPSLLENDFDPEGTCEIREYLKHEGFSHSFEAAMANALLVLKKDEDFYLYPDPKERKPIKITLSRENNGYKAVVGGFKIRNREYLQVLIEAIVSAVQLRDELSIEQTTLEGWGTGLH